MSGDEPELEGPKGFRSRVHYWLTPPANVGAPGWQIIHLDGLGFDGLGEFDPATHLFTPRRSGYYLLIAQIRVQHAFANKWMELRLGNGAWPGLGYEVHYTAAAIQFMLQATTVAYLTPADSIGVFFVNGDVVNNINIIGGGLDSTYLAIHRLS